VASISLVSASETKAACEQALAKEVTQTTMPWATGVEVKVGETSGWQQVFSRKRLGDGAEVTSTASYICLPDAVDPRGPKSGGR